MEEVKEPTSPTELEVQAYVWNELRKKGVNARGEVKAVDFLENLSSGIHA